MAGHPDGPLREQLHYHLSYEANAAFCIPGADDVSGFILLDSMLLCGTVLTVLCWAKFHRLQNESFEPEWFFWLFMTGLSIGCVTSVKLVGLFVTAMVGLYTAEDLWNKFGNLKMPPVSSPAPSVGR